MDHIPDSPSVEVLREQKTPWLPIIALVAIVGIVFGGAYYLSRTSLDPESTESRVEALDTQSTSTEPEAIEADLAAESPEAFEQDFDAAFAELDASLAE